MLLALAAFLMYPGIVADEAVCFDNSDVISHVHSRETIYSSVDSYTSQMWGVSRIEAPRAWQAAGENQPITVAVLDTGIARDNSDLADRVISRVNFTDSPTEDDIYGHGTHLAGTIVSIAPQCQLMSVKVAGDSGRCRASVVARGIIWAADNGAEVINMGLCVKSSLDLERAINYAWERGTILIAAAGNSGSSSPVYPAWYADCIAVAATDKNDCIALLSNHGDWVDVAAPGYKIYSTLPHNSYGYKSGTSSASAHVSGVAALVFSIAEDTNGNGAVNDEVRQAIENSCSPIDAEGLGRGCINAFGAVAEIISSN